MCIFFVTDEEIMICFKELHQFLLLLKIRNNDDGIETFDNE